MSLLKPTRGQMLDRLSILDLKVSHCRGAMLNPAQFSREQEEIAITLGIVTEASDLSTGVGLALNKLREVNHRIWRANEYLAALATTNNPQPNQMALQMWRWNNERVALIEEIDRASGEYVGPEKVGY